MKKIPIIILLVVMLPIYDFGQPQATNLDEYLELREAVQSDLATYKNELRNEFDAKINAQQAAFNEAIEEVREADQTASLVLWIVGSVSGIALIVTLLQAFGIARKQVEKKVQELINERTPPLVEARLMQIIEEDAGPLDQLIVRQRLENKLKETVSFPVLYADTEVKDKSEAEFEFARLGFKNVQTIEFTKYNWENPDPLIVLFDFNYKLIGKHEEALLMKLADIKQLPEDRRPLIVVAYPGQWQNMNNYRSFTNGSNTPATLYHRCLESMLYLHQVGRLKLS